MQQMNSLEKLNEINSDMATMLYQLISSLKEEEFVDFLTNTEFSWEREDVEDLYQKVQNKFKERQDVVNQIATSNWSEPLDSRYSEFENVLMKSLLKQRARERQQEKLNAMIAEYIGDDENKFVDILVDLKNIASGKSGSGDWKMLYENMDVMLRTII